MRSFGIVHRVEFWCITDVSQQIIGPIFNGRAVQEDCLALEDATERNYNSRLN
jgi:hypothetical protein